MMAHISPLTIEEVDRSELNKRFQTRAWALFLITTGSLWFLSNVMMIDGLWLISTGLILLGLNVARALNDIETSGFTVIVGLLALSGGLGNLMGVGLPLVPMLIIGLGALTLIRALMSQKTQ
ncbi:MAG: hypothetical protein KF893_17335 [Caldilineaceae bacterium]|nr:hypothetical protein [Caldilineaceae bacterium]